MKFPLFFRGERSKAAARERQDQAQRALAESLRLLGRFLARLADRVDDARLSRSGYREQDAYLERNEPRRPS